MIPYPQLGYSLRLNYAKSYKTSSILLRSNYIFLRNFEFTLLKSRVSMVRKKNKRRTQSTQSTTPASAEKSQFGSLIVTATELQELVRQGLVVDEVHEVLEYDRKNMPWIDNFVRASMELEKQSNNPREKAYHALMRELFSMKAFRDASSQDGLVSKAEYFRNKIDNRIIDFIGRRQKRMVKPWISCDITPSDNYGKGGRFA